MRGLLVCGCVLCCAHLGLWRAFCAGVVETLLGVCDFSGVGCAWGATARWWCGPDTREIALIYDDDDDKRFIQR